MRCQRPVRVKHMKLWYLIFLTGLVLYSQSGYLNYYKNDWFAYCSVKIQIILTLVFVIVSSVQELNA